MNDQQAFEMSTGPKMNKKSPFHWCFNIQKHNDENQFKKFFM